MEAEDQIHRRFVAKLEVLLLLGNNSYGSSKDRARQRLGETLTTNASIPSVELQSLKQALAYPRPG